MTIDQQLHRSLTDRLDDLSPPAPDLGVVLRKGRSRRRRRQGTVVAALALVASTGLLAAQFGPGALSGLTTQEFQPVGQLDFTGGLRAYMSPDPDGEISLGGRTFPAGDLDYIDTDATATPYGMVFFDGDERPFLLKETGRQEALAPTPEENPKGHPSSKADAALPLAAWTEGTEGGLTVRLYDLSTGRTVATRTVPCDGKACEQVKIDALDQGMVFVRTGDGTFVWDPAAEGDAAWTAFSGPETRVADVRNKRVLHTGPAPAPDPAGPVDDSWSFTKGEIDAQLSFDGEHVLYWSTTLEPTTPDGKPVRLDVKAGEWAFVTFDTDGSVLVATNGPDLSSTVFDCELPSGKCARLGRMSTRNGDPIFVGNDM